MRRWVCDCANQVAPQEFCRDDEFNREQVLQPETCVPRELQVDSGSKRRKGLPKVKRGWLQKRL